MVGRAKFTVLIFSKDDASQALELIADMYGAADEIVLMDAGGTEEKEKLLKASNRYGKKLRMFNIIALGYREPLMMYALKKCSNDWVLALNTDERASERLKNAIPKLLKDPECDAYSVPMYSVWGPKSKTFVSYQVRFFDKNKVEFRGLLHEKPIVRGRFATLAKDECIEHITTGMLHTTKTRYAEMERFERYTYAQHNLRLLGQLDRIKGRDVLDASRLTPAKRALLGLLRIYEALGLKSQEQEVSNFDYYIFWLMRDTAHQARRRSVGGMLAAFPGAAEQARKMREWRSGAYGDEDLEIAKAINRIGITKFLHLDEERTVEALNKKYRNKKQGVELLIKLLRERYEKGKRPS